MFDSACLQTASQSIPEGSMAFWAASRVFDRRWATVTGPTPPGTGVRNPATFLTSSKAEEAQTKALFDKISSTEKVQFVPKGTGEHGSRALWEEKTDHEEYWTALKDFLRD